MIPLLFLALVGVPVLEIALFIEIGGAIGTWATLAAIILTAALGTLLLRSQGSGLMARARTTLDRGEMPVEEVIHGLFLLVAGVLLLTPGFFTDAVGFILCIPAVRLTLGRAVLRRLRDRITVHVSREGPQGRSGGGAAPPPGEPSIDPRNPARPGSPERDRGEGRQERPEPGRGPVPGASKWRPPDER